MNALAFLVALLFAVAAQAQVVFTVGDATAPLGGDAPITISVNGGNGLIAAVGVDLVFDTEDLDVRPTDCTLSPRITGHTLDPFLPVPGRLRLGWLDLVPPVQAFPDGDLATCIFHVLPTASSDVGFIVPINLQASTADVPPRILPLGKPTPGRVTVTGSPDTPIPTVPVNPTTVPTATAASTPAATAARTPKPTPIRLRCTMSCQPQ